jgi:tetratricopeptide (TPR) repeat protein
MAARAETAPSPLWVIVGRLPEAAWLYALCVAPSVFGIAYTRNFDLLKTVYFRGTMAVVVVVAIVAFALGPPAAGAAYGQGRGWSALDRRQRSAVVAAALVLISLLLSTGLGILPRVSLAGSHLRNFGLFTEAMHVLLFLAVLLGLRSVAQLWRAIDVVVAGSVVVVLYGLSQAFGADPLGLIYSGRGFSITSTIGNSLFLGGYLVTAILATSARLVSLRAQPSSPAAPDPVGLRIVVGGALSAAVALVVMLVGVEHPGPWWLLPAAPFACLLVVAREWTRAPSFWTRRHDTVALAALLGLQCLALLRTGARTSWVAVALAMLLFALWTLRRRSVRLAAVVGSTLAVLAVAVVLGSTMSSSPIEGLRRAPVVGSLISAAGQRLSVESRVAIWKDVLALVRSRGAGVIAGDPFLPARPLVGHGAGTLYVTLDQFASEERTALESGRVDRAHNELLDRLATLGALGLASWLALLAALVALAVAALRRLARSHDRAAVAFVAAGLAGIAIGDAFGPGDATSRIYFWFLAGAIAAAPLLTAAAPAVAATAVLNGVPAHNGANGSGASRAHRSRPAGRRSASAPTPSAPWGAHWWGVAYALPLAVGVCLLAAVPRSSSYSGHVLLTSVVVVLSLFGLALHLSGLGLAAIRPTDLRRAIVPAAAAAALVLVSVALFLRITRPAEADLYNRVAVLGTLEGHSIEAVLYARQAIEISPNEELYYMGLGGALGEIARIAPDRPAALPPGDPLILATSLPLDRMAQLSRQDFFRLAEASFLRARELNPYDAVHYQNLIGLADVRADLGDAGAREQVLAYIRLGLARMPSHPLLQAEYNARLAGGRSPRAGP